MLSEKKVVQFLIDGEYKSGFVEKSVLGYNELQELDIIKLKAVIDGVEYHNTIESLGMEFAIIGLQQQMPDNVLLACCQTCSHGNFCPFGDNENEIFCLKNYTLKNKMDVVEIFASDLNAGLPKNELLFLCESYNKINDDTYTYNCWNYYFKGWP